MMSPDVFAEWKDSRFIIAPYDLVDDEKLVILTDYKFWADNVDELFNWCEERDTVVTQGMTVVFSDEITLMEFVLKWS
jgi:hypothetical protein